jgi:PAS domain S-box-containing protein
METTVELDQVVKEVAEKRGHILLERLAEIICCVNLQGRITYLNHAWTDLCGFTVEETLGTQITDYLEPAAGATQWKYFRTVGEAKSALNRNDVRIRCKSGQYRWFDSRARGDLSSLGLTVGLCRQPC